MKTGKIIRTYASIFISLAFLLSVCFHPETNVEKNLIIGFMAAVSIVLFAFSSIFYGKKPSYSFVRAGVRADETIGASVTFKDVAANENAKEAFMEIADFLKSPEKYERAGARIPHGVLLYGPPGTGKTLLARALAGEAGVPFIAMNGSDFVEMYVGVGAGRVRDVFKRARKHGKCVVFIDEIDSLGRARGLNSSDERDQTLNALLSEMSGFKNSDGIIVVAATNRAEMLDGALLRPGRFDKRIEVGMPGVQEREKILRLHAKNKPVAENVNFEKLARQTVFFSGASIENLLNDAAIRAVRRNSETIQECDIQDAYVYSIAGAVKKQERARYEKEQIAIHEAGHAVSMKILSPMSMLKRITVLPSTSGAQGYNLSVPEEKALYTRREMENQICVLLSGRAAEMLAFGEDGVTGGASNDLKRATEIAVSMVTELGMGSKSYVSENALMKAPGGGTDAFMQAERILKRQFERANETLKDHLALLLDLSRTLFERESLGEEEIDEIFGKYEAASSNDCRALTAFEKVG